MPKNLQKPTVKPGLRAGEEEYAHPAYGSVSIRRQQTTDVNLFDSNVPHSDIFVLEITGAEMHRSLNRDRVYPTKPLIKVAMTPAQLGEMMGSANSGRGVPCTIQRIGNEGAPMIEAERTTKRFGKEANEQFHEIGKMVGQLVSDMEAKLTEAKVSSKRQKEMLEPLEKLQRTISGNLPFMQEQFYESLEGMLGEIRAQATSFKSDDEIQHLLLGKSTSETE